LKIEEREIRPLKENEVLVKMEAAPCNPSDIAFLRGGYNIKKPLTAVPGFEGTGLVVEAGAVAKSLIGERVSCFVQEDSDGTWAEFFIARKQDCIVLKENMPIEQAACFAINPLTAFGMYEIAQRANCKAFILNAAGGQVPNLIRAFAKKDGIQVVNIVRKETQLNELVQKGEVWVLDSSDDNFQNKLEAVCKKLKPSFAFDAVGGEMTAQLFYTMPAQSQVVVYGGLSGNAISGIDTMEVIFKGKKLLGFNLNDWIDAKSSDEFFTLTNKLQDMFISGELKTEIQASVTLDDIVKGIRTYIKSMSGGKVLFVP
jgi:NADPH:quinone reductase-like Zn-dependent oxidoreductase